jgi:hypothetical protein
MVCFPHCQITTLLAMMRMSWHNTIIATTTATPSCRNFTFQLPGSNHKSSQVMQPDQALGSMSCWLLAATWQLQKWAAGLLTNY